VTPPVPAGKEKDARPLISKTHDEGKREGLPKAVGREERRKDAVITYLSLPRPQAKRTAPFPKRQVRRSFSIPLCPKTAWLSYHVSGQRGRGPRGRHPLTLKEKEKKERRGDRQPCFFSPYLLPGRDQHGGKKRAPGECFSVERSPRIHPKRSPLLVWSNLGREKGKASDHAPGRREKLVPHLFPHPGREGKNEGRAGFLACIGGSGEKRKKEKERKQGALSVHPTLCSPRGKGREGRGKPYPFPGSRRGGKKEGGGK